MSPPSSQRRALFMRHAPQERRHRIRQAHTVMSFLPTWSHVVYNSIHTTSSPYVCRKKGESARESDLEKERTGERIEREREGKGADRETGWERKKVH